MGNRIPTPRPRDRARRAPVYGASLLSIYTLDTVFKAYEVIT